MKGEIRTSLSAAAAAAAAAVMLIACASKESMDSRSVAASTQDETAAEYQRLADNANQQLSCKRKTVLGSLVPTVVCVTQAELKAQREHADEVMHDLRANEPMNREALPPPPPSSPKQ